MNKRINDIRRVILAMCFFGLVLSLIGTELPWCKITQPKAENPLYIVEQPTCNATLNNNTLPEVNELVFALDIYFTLASTQLCQTFTKGKLPDYVGGAVLNDIRMCTDLKFNQVSNFMQDVSEWDSYSKQCGSAGGGSFFFIIIAIIIITVTMLINTFPKTVKKCCEDQDSFRNKFVRSLVAFFAPACVTFALIIYSVNCVSGDIGDVLTKHKMDRSGSGGYYICALTCAMLWIYWALFIFRMCDNEVQIDFKGAGDIRAKFLSKETRKESESVDAGMLDESQENREAIRGANAYENDAYRPTDNQEDDEQNRKGTISAYDDGGVAGPPSAGTWQDVEED